MRAGWLIVLAACGDNVAPDAIACTADLRGNFVESSTSPDNCPTISGRTFELALPSATLGTELAIAIELGSASPGHYSSVTVPRWSVLAVQRIGNGACQYSAGSDAVPQGSFELALETLEPATGTLALTVNVLTVPGTDCGDHDIEDLVLGF